MATPLIGIFTGLGFSAGAASFLAGVVARLAFAAIMLYVSKKLTKEPSRAELNRELQKPSNQPPKRFVYGRTSVYGSYAPIRIVGGKLFGCLIVNSRPSVGNFTISIDKRPVTLTGDPFNFAAGGGATATNAPFAGHLRIWFGLGDQTSPPANFLTGAPDYFQATDGWQGLTVVWVELDAGANADRSTRWPRVPPELEVEGDFSYICDIRQPSHDILDPSTWQFSNNQALCLLDFLTQNPIEPYRLDNLYMDSFVQAANIADEAVALKGGGAEPRYRVGGFIRFDDSEMEDQMEPLVMAGGGFISRVGGKLGYVAGAYSSPVYTLTDIIDDRFEFTALGRSRDLPTQIRTSYVSPARLYDEAELEPWDIPNAQAEDGGIPKVRDLKLIMVHSPTQAMRLRKIYGMNMRLQKRLSGVAPPSAFKMIGGSGMTVDLPAPLTKLNGDYQVTMIHPAFDYLGMSGVSMRCPFEARENSYFPYLWNGETEEEEVLNEPFDPDRKIVLPCGGVSLTTAPYGAEVEGGGIVVRQRYLIEFAPSPSTSVTSYNWQYAEAGGPWQFGGSILSTTVNVSGNVYGSLENFDPNVAHKVRVQATSINGDSAWTESALVQYGFNLTGVAANAAAGRAEFTGTAPNTDTMDAVRVFMSPTSNFSNAVAVGGDQPASPNSAFSIAVGDLTATNLAENAGFDSDTVWIKGIGWTIGGGKASHASGAVGYLSQPETIEDGEVYRFTMTISDRTDGTISPRLIGGTEQVGTAFSGNFPRQTKITGTAGNDGFAFAASTTFDGSLDDIYVLKETPSCLDQGTAWFWVAPVSNTGQIGSTVGPFELLIP